jgi:hypothetical protein
MADNVVDDVIASAADKPKNSKTTKKLGTMTETSAAQQSSEQAADRLATPPEKA